MRVGGLGVRERGGGLGVSERGGERLIRCWGSTTWPPRDLTLYPPEALTSPDRQCTYHPQQPHAPHLAWDRERNDTNHVVVVERSGGSAQGSVQSSRRLTAVARPQRLRAVTGHCTLGLACVRIRDPPAGHACPAPAPGPGATPTRPSTWPRGHTYSPLLACCDEAVRHTTASHLP